MYVYASASLKGCVAQSRAESRRAAPRHRFGFLFSPLLSSVLGVRSLRKAQQSKSKSRSIAHWIGLDCIPLHCPIACAPAVPSPFPSRSAMRSVSSPSRLSGISSFHATRRGSTLRLHCSRPPHAMPSHLISSLSISASLTRASAISSHSIRSDPIRILRSAPLRIELSRSEPNSRGEIHSATRPDPLPAGIVQLPRFRLALCGRCNFVATCERLVARSLARTHSRLSWRAD